MKNSHQMKRGKSLTVMIPAYNEEKNLARATREINSAVKGLFSDYEILIFNDCSSDRTGKIADALAKKNKHIRVVHNEKNMGLGYNYREGLRLAKKEYYTLFYGDSEVIGSSIREILSHVGEADILVPYIENPELRAMYRRVISRGFTILLNVLFGLHLRYYNAGVIHKTKLLKTVKMTTNSFGYQAEVLIQLLKRGYTYKEFPYKIYESDGGSECLKIKNLVGVALTVIRLFFEVHFTQRKKIRSP